MKDFEKFILRGNVVDLAIGVVIGASFGAVVTALVKDLITPLVAAIGGQPNFSTLSFTINHSKFMYGSFLNALIAFIILAIVIFFLIVVPMNKLLALRKTEEIKTPNERTCPECLSNIPAAAKRCMYCGVASKPTKPQPEAKPKK